MTKLARAVTIAVVEEFGLAETLRRLSDPCLRLRIGLRLA
jgi:hypothetical protein